MFSGFDIIHKCMKFFSDLRDKYSLEQCENFLNLLFLLFLSFSIKKYLALRTFLSFRHYIRVDCFAYYLCISTDKIHLRLNLYDITLSAN